MAPKQTRAGSRERGLPMDPKAVVMVRCAADATHVDVLAALSSALVAACERFGIDPSLVLGRLAKVEADRRAGKLEPIDTTIDCEHAVVFPAAGGDA